MNGVNISLCYITDEEQLWKFDGTTLVNKKSTSTIKGEWKFVPEGETFCIENTENNKVLSLASDSGDDIEVKEMFRSNELRQLWKIGPPNEEGFFIITEASSKKVLIGDGDDFKIDGNFAKKLFLLLFSLKYFRNISKYLKIEQQD